MSDGQGIALTVYEVSRIIACVRTARLCSDKVVLDIACIPDIHLRLIAHVVIDATYVIPGNLANHRPRPTEPYKSPFGRQGHFAGNAQQAAVVKANIADRKRLAVCKLGFNCPAAAKKALVAGADAAIN